jgi:ribosomal protein S27AE
MDSKKCMKCGSTKIIPNVQIQDQGQYSDGHLKVVIAEDPKALFFKNNRLTRLKAQICGECGYTEFIVEDPHMLYSAYIKSLDPT